MRTTKRMILAAMGLLVTACTPGVADGPAVTQTLLPFATTARSTSTMAMLTPLANTPAAPTSTPFLHLVAEGETMIGIAVRYGVSLDDLLIANPGVDPGFLSIGQELIIPGPEGSTVSGLLPTPTPLPVQPEPVRCYPAPSEAVWCITQVENTTDFPLEGVSILLSILDADGAILEQYPLYSPLDILPVGEVLPFAILLEQPSEAVAGGFAQVLAAVPAQGVEERYPQLEIRTDETVIATDGSQAVWQGSISMETNIPGEQGSLRALLMGFDAGGNVVGFRIFEGEIGTAVGSEVEIELMVFSLLPDIDVIRVIAEVEPQLP